MMSQNIKDVLFKYGLRRTTPHPIDRDYVWYGKNAQSLAIDH